MKNDNWLIAFIVSLILIVMLPFFYVDLPSYLTQDQHDLIIILYMGILIGFDVMVMIK